jgi:hypothetical protein
VAIGSETYVNGILKKKKIKAYKGKRQMNTSFA